FTALGFSQEMREVTTKERSTGLVEAVFMREQTFRMEEVMVYAKPPFRHVGDTLIFDAASYRTGEEQVIGDLFKRLPGFDVDEDGTVRIGNQKIEKIMVEGDDFFNKAYPIITKTLPAFPIAEVQVLKNYADKAILKDLEKSDKIALNITLSEAYQHVWFGNIMAGLGPQKSTSYDLKAEAMNFGRHNKYFLLVDLNNTGRLTSSWADLLMEAESENSLLSNYLHALPEIEPPEAIYQDKRGLRTLFQHGETISLNNILQLSPNWKLKTISFFNLKRTELSERIHEMSWEPTIAYERNERLSHFGKNREGLAQVEVAGEWGLSASFTSLSKVHAARQDNNILGNMNAQVFDVSEENVPSSLEQSFKYIKRWTSRSAFIWDGQLTIGSLQEAFLRDSVAIQRNHRFHQQGTSLKFINRKSPSESWTFEAGLLHIQDEFSLPSLSPDSSWAPYDQEYVHWTSRFQTVKWLSQAIYQKNIGRLELQGKGRSIQYLSGYHPDRRIRFSPGLSIGWSFKSDHKISLGYTHSHVHHQASEFIPVYTRSTYRSAMRGVQEAGNSEMSTWVMNHLYNNWDRGIFIHSMGYLAYFHKTLTSKIHLNPSFNWSERIWVNDPFMMSFQSGVDYYHEPISSNVKFKFLWNRSRTYTQLNSNSLTAYLNSSHQFELELRSAFSGIFNYHIGAKRRRSIAIDKQIPNDYILGYESFVDIYIKPEKDWTITTEFEWYYSDHTGRLSTHQFFINSTLRYQFMRDRFSLSVIGENLLNEKYLNHFQRNEFAFIQHRQSLVPRRVIFRLSCRI
ncbi:MAG TPA: hypothetical protein VFD72_02955, partial [Sphingobacteriaceae bacterium]|nr:hypothetical protein [Sphingobacteriaceae bacterium]